jgi:SAM-dependent methyltransferase
MHKNSLSSLTAMNLATWDERAAIHVHDKSGFFAINRFRAGEDIMFPIESEEIGCVNNKNLLHLQCHIGLETLCLARRGAQVSGLDFSGSSVAAAQLLAKETNIKAHFVQSDVYDATDALKKTYDIIYVSWGSLNWLPDIWQWGRIVADLLAPGGFLYLIEQHPFISMMKEHQGSVTPGFAFRTPPDRPIISEMPTSYNEDAVALVHTRIHEWEHPLSDILTSLITAGLRLDFLHEHERITWKRLSIMVPAEKRLYKLPDTHVPLPLAFSLKASKPVVL